VPLSPPRMRLGPSNVVSADRSPEQLRPTAPKFSSAGYTSPVRCAGQSDRGAPPCHALTFDLDHLIGAGQLLSTVRKSLPHRPVDPPNKKRQGEAANAESRQGDGVTLRRCQPISHRPASNNTWQAVPGPLDSGNQTGRYPAMGAYGANAPKAARRAALAATSSTI
jgi:hypothetical protein